MEGHRYADEPDSRWYPDRFGADGERPAADPPRVPEQRYPYSGGADRLDLYGGAHSYPAERDGADTGVRSAHDALRFPLRPDDPARPVSAAPPQSGPLSAFGDAAGGGPGRGGSGEGTGLGALDFGSSRAGGPGYGDQPSGRGPDAPGFDGFSRVAAPGSVSDVDPGRGGPGQSGPGPSGPGRSEAGQSGAEPVGLGQLGLGQADRRHSGLGEPASGAGTQALGGPVHSIPDPTAAPTAPIAPAGAFRPTGPAAAGGSGPVTAAGPPSPVSGAAAEPTGLLPPVQHPASSGFGESRTPAPEGVYRTRRPAIAILLVAGVAVLGIPAVRLFVEASFADVPTAREIVPSCLLLLGLPLTGLGLYALAGGGRPVDRAAWLRPPVGYLTVGLALLAAAALAVG